MTEALLQVTGLRAGYGKITAVRDVAFGIAKGSALAVLGPNGAGKTTMVEAIVGLLPKEAGVVRFAGTDISRLPASSIVRRGLATVPQWREIFYNFTVVETLATAEAAAVGRAPVPTQEIFELFPQLSERRNALGGNLSGGEQQMLAIGRALVTRPSLLILDEPSAGLATGIVNQVAQALLKIRRGGVSLVIVEQNLELAATLAEDCIVMVGGEIAWQGDIRGHTVRQNLIDAYFRN